jgi:hypothetical protein
MRQHDDRNFADDDRLDSFRQAMPVHDLAR